MYLSNQGINNGRKPVKYFRKPAIYVSLPTKGNFNPEIEQTIIDEVGVLPMTAIDEISLRNPDALLNGEAMISVIEKLLSFNT